MIDYVELEKSYRLEKAELFDDISQALKNWNNFIIHDGEFSQHVDFYYDTKRLLLYNTNKTLRIRKDKDSYFLIIKIPTFDEFGRLEHIKYIENPNINLNKNFIIEHIPELNEQWEYIINILTITKKRKPLKLIKNDTKLEIVFDQVNYVSQSGEAYENQLEIELKSDYYNRPDLENLIEFLEKNFPEIEAITDSKYKRGLYLTGVDISPISEINRMSMFRDI